MFKGQPKGLFALALANTGERFGYYTMLAIFMLFLQAKFGFDGKIASQIYSIFLALVYFMPVVGGWLADKIGFGKCVVTGICVMFAGYAALSVPTSAGTLGLVLMIGALVLISVGTGLFKGYESGLKPVDEVIFLEHSDEISYVNGLYVYPLIVKYVDNLTGTDKIIYSFDKLNLEKGDKLTITTYQRIILKAEQHE